MPDKFPMDEVYPPPSRSGWNWGGCLALVLIIAVFAGLLLPVVLGVVNSTGKQSMCGKNQSQIIGALVAYSTSEEVGFLPRYLPADEFTGATRGRYVTTKIFETLSASLNIGSSLFRCPSSAIGGPNRHVKPDPGNPTSTWGWGDNYGMTYAFDWAAPADPLASRVLLADRNPKAHADHVWVTFGDAHVKKVKWVPMLMLAESGLVTEGIDGKPMRVSTAVSPDDDIYSTLGDGGEPLTEGKGDPLRAWVK